MRSWPRTVLTLALLTGVIGCDRSTVRVPDSDSSPPEVDFVWSSSFRDVGYFPADGTLEDIRPGEVVGPSDHAFKVVEPADGASLSFVARARDPESGIQQQITQHWFRIHCAGVLSDRSETRRSEYSAGTVEAGDELATNHGQAVSFRVREVVELFDCPREDVEMISLSIQSFADNGAADGGSTTETFDAGIMPEPIGSSDAPDDTAGDDSGAAPQAVVNLDLRAYCGNCSTCAASVEADAEYRGTMAAGTGTGDGTRSTSFSRTSGPHTVYRRSTFDDAGDEVCYHDHPTVTVTDLEPGTWNLEVVDGGPHGCTVALASGTQTVIFGVNGCDE